MWPNTLWSFKWYMVLIYWSEKEKEKEMNCIWKSFSQEIGKNVTMTWNKTSHTSAFPAYQHQKWSADRVLQVQISIKHGGSSIKVWGCISASGIGNLVKTDGLWTQKSKGRFWSHLKSVWFASQWYKHNVNVEKQLGRKLHNRTIFHFSSKTFLKKSIRFIILYSSNSN